MILNYKTGKLPQNFIYLGVMLFGLGIWRMIVLDWKGILFFVISVLFLFIKSGILIDTDNKRLKKYIGIFAIRKGNWENIKSLINLRIVKTNETESMSVLSITRMETNIVYKLIMVLPDKNIELISGESDFVIKAADEISHELNAPLVND
jgi:hypothetical protein